ncbi:MAG: nucleotidyltransferase domain-containing protein [Lentisphaerae bacterium]|nr:nucleotidyltransferase domain-containing protein [Lentisphaerota bacterium]
MNSSRLAGMVEIDVRDWPGDTAGVVKLLLENIPPELEAYRSALEKCLRAFEGVVQVQEVRLFGSFARGDAKDDSDVDLCIVARGAEHQLETARRFRRAIRHIRPKPAMTLVPISPDRLEEKRKCGDHFFKTVFEEGIPIASED